MLLFLLSALLLAFLSALEHGAELLERTRKEKETQRKELIEQDLLIDLEAVNKTTIDQPCHNQTARHTITHRNESMTYNQHDSYELGLNKSMMGGTTKY